MERLAQDNVEMNHPTEENQENDPHSVQLLLNKPTEASNSPTIKIVSCKWKIIIRGAIFAIIFAIAAGIIVWIVSVSPNGSGVSNKNSSLEGGAEKTAKNTTDNCTILRNQTDYYLCTRGPSDFLNDNFSLPGYLVCIHCPLSEREQSMYYIAAMRGTWSESKRLCREMGGQLFTLKDQRTLKVIQDQILDDFSYWFAASCVPSGTCTWTDGTPFDPTLFNVTPQRGGRSCGALQDGKIRFEMCADKRRFVCESRI